MKNPLFPGDQTQVVADAIITRALEAISTRYTIRLNISSHRVFWCTCGS